MALVKSSFAGTWYPGTKKQIEQKLAEFRTKVKRPSKLKKPPIAGIVPHAGWMYSGQVAYEVWDNVAGRKPDLVVLFGGHMHPHMRPLAYADEGFDTPLGPLMIHRDLLEALSASFRFRMADAASWEPDNTTEVQLPMVKYLMPEARLLILHLPPRDTILDVVDTLMDAIRRAKAKAVFVGSTDLTHYGPRYGLTSAGVGEKGHRWAKTENDAAFIAKLIALDPQGCLEEGLSNQNACCPGAASAAVTAARLTGSEYGELLTHTSSYEVVPMSDPVDFVGYCSVVF